MQVFALKILKIISITQSNQCSKSTWLEYKLIVVGDLYILPFVLLLYFFQYYWFIIYKRCFSNLDFTIRKFLIISKYRYKTFLLFISDNDPNSLVNYGIFIPRALNLKYYQWPLILDFISHCFNIYFSLFLIVNIL